MQVGDHSINGSLVALQPDPDINTNTHQIRVRIAGQILQAGMLAVATLPLAKQADAVVVPVPAVLNLRGKTFVYVVQNNRLKKTAVQLGRRFKNDFIVLSGVTPGQKIIARDVTSLADGQAVVLE